jgi:hypothetical protein
VLRYHADGLAIADGAAYSEIVLLNWFMQSIGLGLAFNAAYKTRWLFLATF